MGVDPNLIHNLETYFTMIYPVYELLFCIENKDDPAIETVKRLIEKYPNIDTQLFIGGSNVGVNPKINNMNPGYLAAKYELIMISDSGVKSMLTPDLFLYILLILFIFVCFILSARRYTTRHGISYEG